MKCESALGAIVALGLTGGALASVVTVDYEAYVGGTGGSSTGLTAQATWTSVGTMLTIELSNTSVGAPGGATVADTLLVSLAFDLGQDAILSGDSIVVGAGSTGLGAWSGLGAGDSIAEQWVWSNTGSGDYLANFAQVVTTSSGLGGGTPNAFGGGPVPGIDGPFGGIAAAPPILPVPNAQEAVSDSILITLTLTGELSSEQLQSVADAAVVEFGSDFAYVSTVPAPSALAVFALGLGGARRRRRA